MNKNPKWVLGEVVYCWSSVANGFFQGTVESFDNLTLKVRTFANGKVYNFNADGTAIISSGRTNKRVFSIRELNEITSQEDADELL